MTILALHTMLLRRRTVWSGWKAVTLLLNTLQIPSTQIRSTTAKIVRIVKTADKLRGCKKEEYLKEIFKLSENINLSNRLTNQGGAQGACPPPGN